MVRLTSGVVISFCVTQGVRDWPHIYFSSDEIARPFRIRVFTKKIEFATHFRPVSLFLQTVWHSHVFKLLFFICIVTFCLHV